MKCPDESEIKAILIGDLASRLVIGPPVRIDSEWGKFSICIESDWYSVVSQFEVSIERLAKFIADLEKLSRFEDAIVYFSPEYGNLEINIQLHRTGTAQVSGTIGKNLIEDEYLRYSFASNIGAIDNLIRSLKLATTMN